MARPKTLKKPSKKREARRKQREAKKFGWGTSSFQIGQLGDWGATVGDHVTGVATVTANQSSAVTITGPSARFVMPEYQVAIESLDEGWTWHTTDTMEPARNNDGELLVGTAPCGRAPEFMRPGSGTYRFEITYRGATEAEERQWAQEHNWVQSWTTPTEGIRDYVRPQIETAPDPRAAEEQRALLLAEKERWEARQSAERRARALLLSHLSRQAKADLESRGGFWVTSQFKNRYWVTKNSAVRFDDRGAAIQRYCIHAVNYEIPAEDNALLRKLVLECDEDLFLRTANPSQPSEWDIGAAIPVVTIPPGVTANRQVVATGGQVNLTGGGITDYVSIAAIQCLPILLWVNGVVRPLCG